MEQKIKELNGSPFNDAVRYWHKHLKDTDDLYASDIDLALIRKGEPIAILDAKSNVDNLAPTWTETQLYDWFEKRGKPVYMIRPLDSTCSKCAKCSHVDIAIDPNSRILMVRYSDGLQKVFDTPEEYIAWERKLRNRL